MRKRKPDGASRFADGWFVTKNTKKQSHKGHDGTERAAPQAFILS
jgi:hypothetical protein